MPYALPDTALVTPADVLRAQAGGVAISLPRDTEEVGAIIEAVSAEIDEHLDRHLMARTVTQRPTWRYDTAESIYTAYPIDWPVNTVPTGYTIRPGSRLIGLDTDAVDAPALSDALVYVAGYRRADQTGEDYDATPYDDAPLVPADIARFCVDAVLYRWNAAQAGVGIQATEIDTRQAVVRRTGVRPSWWAENAPRIARHRFIAP